MLLVFLPYGAAGVLAVRLALGVLFIVHGFKKMKDLSGTAAWFGSVGFRPGRFWATIVAILESVAGIAFILGIGTQVFAALLAVQFVTIIVWRLRTHAPFVGGWELDLLVLAMLIALILLGAGAYSLDRMFLIG